LLQGPLALAQSLLTPRQLQRRRFDLGTIALATFEGLPDLAAMLLDLLSSVTHLARRPADLLLQPRKAVTLLPELCPGLFKVLLLRRELRWLLGQRSLPLLELGGPGLDGGLQL